MDSESDGRCQKGMSMTTSSTEGFYRSHNNSSSRTGNASSAAAQNDGVSSLPLPVQPQTMDRSAPVSIETSSLSSATPTAGVTRSGTTRPGSLRPPNELGRQESIEERASADNNYMKSKGPGIHPRSAAVRKRTMEAIRGSMKQAASALSAEALAAAKEKFGADNPSMLCSLTYRGMEIIFASTQAPQCRIYAICARTRLVLQTLDLPPPESKPNDSISDRHRKLGTTNNRVVVAVTANQSTGMIAVAMSDGTVQTYLPTTTNPAVHPFGRFRWVNGVTIRCSLIFYQQGETRAFISKRHAKPGQSIELSSSRDQRLLVAHRNQLAVFDARVQGSSDVASQTSNLDVAKTAAAPPPAQLLWTASVEKQIVTASISGDGQALAVVEDSEARFGVLIFLRDHDDGSFMMEDNGETSHNVNATLQPEKLTAQPVGILYKQGTFLEHSKPVSRISFRGLGHNTASMADEKGDDLLLTFSRYDNVACIFNQQSWKILVEWTTPRNTRVDWVRGAAAFSLGDLETQKRLVPKTDSKPPSRSPSSQALGEDQNGFGQGLLQGGRQLLHNSSPSSAAGAWIAETTFSGAFPAVRLSRLSFLKRGSETMHPALFESVASVLPAGSMDPDIILRSSDESLSIHGIWPAWNPWLSETSDGHSEETLSGSAMAFLGLSSGPSAGQGGHFGEGILGGTHSPPNELRVVASHALCGNVVVMEFPLWGNRDLGELELGSAIRYILSLPDIEQTRVDGDYHANSDLLTATNFESNRLVAKLRPDAASIALTWRKQGTMSICPASWEPQDYEKALEETAFAEAWTGEMGIAECFRDRSLVPAPLSLPPIFLPRDIVSAAGGEHVHTVVWWPDENFGGPPLLVVITSSGTLLVFEVPPPWSAQEPPMPNDDPFLDFGGSVKGVDSVELSAIGTGTGTGTGTDNDSNDGASMGQKEYDVMITPDPDFGLGLRLESQLDGMPAIAGSYKKHPVTGGRLPAEKVGMIVLGDELLSVDGVRLEGISFDEIIATVRQVGAASGPGKPLCMRFRHVNGRRRNDNGEILPPPMPVEVQMSDCSLGSMEQTLGVKAQRLNRVGSSAASSVSSATRPLSLHGRGDTSGEEEVQQEFCRLVAVTREALPSMKKQAALGSKAKKQANVVLLPWPPQKSGLSSSHGLRGGALLFFADGSKIYGRCLEVSSDRNPNSGKVRDVGYLDMKNDTTDADFAGEISSMSAVDTGSESNCLAVCDNHGSVQLIFAYFEDQEAEAAEAKTSLQSITFRQYGIFKFDAPMHDRCDIRASSIALLATMRYTRGEMPTLTVWSARPHPAGKKHTCTSDLHQYIGSNISDNKDLVDFCFVQSGFLDSFPLLASFSTTEVILYQKVAEWLGWSPVRVVSYSDIPGSGIELMTANSSGSSSPLDSFPHLMTGLRLIVNSDEIQHLRPDWHPDTLLAHICTNRHGPQDVLSRKVASYFLWLAKGVRKEDTKDVPRVSALASVNLKEPIDNGCAIDLSGSKKQSTSHDLFAKIEQQTPSEDEAMLRKLQSVLANGFAKRHYKAEPTLESGKHVPVPPLPIALHSFAGDDLRILWALGEVVLARLDFESLDVNGGFFLFTSELFRKIKDLPKEDHVDQNRKQNDPMHSFSFNRKASKPTEDIEIQEQLPSSATLFALMSNSQNKLVESCRTAGVGIDWKFMKEYNIPFWIRSDAVVAKLSEEVGQTSFRAKRDILESALFFIICRKHRMLRNLAATDQSDSGRKFFSFITTHDFSSERGRRAAEKNAYSLLRKRRYTVAASFFLLAEPPFLKSSLEVIATQLQDLNLAFLVARLMESPVIATQNSESGVNFGSLPGMGGGGGYATSFGSTLSSHPPTTDEVNFSNWVPDLKKGAKTLLLDRGFSLSGSDNCLTAIQLIWLNQRHEASFWLAGLARDKKAKSALPDVGDTKLPYTPDRQRIENKSFSSSPTLTVQPRLRVLSRINMLVDFFTGPMLLKAMGAPPRSRFASSLLISDALMRCGVLLPAVKELLEDCNVKEMEERKKVPVAQNQSTSEDYNGLPSSSIFDDYEAPPGKASLGMSTSMDGPKLRPSQNTAGGTAQSSIFDDFNVAPTRKAATSSVADMNSSIFDSFDAPRSMPKKQNQDQMLMQSSIFDVFDAAPPPKLTQTAGPQSSIFDSFDVPKPTPNVAQSSIFADFDPAPAKQKVAQEVPGGMMTSSIFDSFDAPLPPKKIAPVSEDRSSKLDQRDTTNAGNEAEAEEEGPPIDSLEPSETPKLWIEWRGQVLLFSAAKRLVREIACLMVELHGDAFDPPVLSFSKEKNSLLPAGAAEVLQLPCEGEQILARIGELNSKIASSHNLNKTSVVELALHFLGVPQHHNRLFYAVLLHLSNQRGDLAEDLIRDAAHLMISRCDALALANDPALELGKTCSQMSSLYVRQQMARLSWQIELCLWLHRGGALPLSGTAINEAIVAVRVGFTIASWNRNYECLETMIKSEPDCHIDAEAGRQHWTSLKIISNLNSKDQPTGKATSGGWEFLVDCRRSEATDLLRHKQTGCFIIRPHVEDHGVFTLSFKTNLVPTPNPQHTTAASKGSASRQQDEADKPARKPARPVKKDDVVQHAIIRLSDSGFRCGSFGPFGSLMKLLEAVSASLPFDLRFDQPPAERVIKDEGSQPSPNAVFLRKLVLRNADSLVANPPSPLQAGFQSRDTKTSTLRRANEKTLETKKNTQSEDTIIDYRQRAFGLFLELLILSAVRKPLSGIASSKYEDEDSPYQPDKIHSKELQSVTHDEAHASFDEQYAASGRMLRPFLAWCRVLELNAECEFAPGLKDVPHSVSSPQITLSASETAIEAIEEEVCRGDSVIRRMIQPNSGVDFRTLRLADGGDSTVVVLFSKTEAVEWLIKHGSEKTNEGALDKLESMEQIRVIEPIDLSRLQLKAYSAQKGAKPEQDTGVRYRIVDPWEVEALDNREGETRSASIGRERFLAFSLGKVATSCETTFRRIGGLAALELWTSAKGGVALTKAIASVHPPWERGEGGDMQFVDGAATEPTPFSNSIRQHLYRNSLFRSIRLPQRFLALVQVELLDLKNLTAPGGSLSLTVYALLRLRRSDSGAPLTCKTRTLDSAATLPMKLAKSSGPNAPASWGSVVRFRFPLPEDVSCDGVSLDRNREILFKGPPCVLQLSVYERKLLIDNPLGDADVKIDGLAAGGQLEEWVPLRTGKHGINWFARIRLTLRFELMCLTSEDGDDLAPSVGLRRIQHLSRMGAAQEDLKKSMSTPDLLSYFESMVY